MGKEERGRPAMQLEMDDAEANAVAEAVPEDGEAADGGGNTQPPPAEEMDKPMDETEPPLNAANEHGRPPPPLPTPAASASVAGAGVRSALPPAFGGPEPPGAPE